MFVSPVFITPGRSILYLIIPSEARRESEFIILSRLDSSGIASVVRFSFGHKSFFRSVWYQQLPSNDVETEQQSESVHFSVSTVFVPVLAINKRFGRKSRYN